MNILSLIVTVLIILQKNSLSTSQLHVKRIIISIKDQAFLNFSPHPTHRKLKDILEPAKLELRKNVRNDHSLILGPDQDIESDIYEDQNVIFEVEGEPQVISLTEKLNNMQSQINEIRDELKKLDAINKRQDKIVLFNKYTWALLDATTELHLEQDQSINAEVRDELFNLGQYYNINYISHYIYKNDCPSIKQYKLQILTEKWLSMPKSIRKEFDIVYCSGFYEEIKCILISTSNTISCIYPITSDDVAKSLSPEEVAVEIRRRVEKWWLR